MEINLNLKIKGGKRTPISVEIYGTSANTKVIEFSNGKIITGEQIAKWINSELTKALKKFAGESQHED